MPPQIADWVDKTEGDYRVATRELTADHPVYEAVCFHAQQCVEKYLKAVLESAGRTAPRTHDLAYLFRLESSLWPGLSAYQPDLVALTVHAVAARYPGTAAGRSEAEASVTTTDAARRILRAALGLTTP